MECKEPVSGDNTYQCLLCEEIISSETDSREHLIPNAIGGRKKVSGFLCRSCNSKTGEEWDVKLAYQMNPLSLFFRINRERGNSPSQKFSTVSGAEWILNSDGTLDLPKPLYEKREKKKSVEIRISARSMSEAKKMLEGVARKYPKFDVDEQIERAKSRLRYVQEPIKFSLSFGGIEVGCSIVKTALSLLHTTGVSVRSCEHAVRFLTKKNSEPCFGYYYEQDIVANRPAGVPIHCVHVNGDPDQGLIRGYVEYFGVMRVVMCLSNSYSGSPFSTTYAIDPTKGEELDLSIELGLTAEDIRKAYAYEKWDDETAKRALIAVMEPTLKAQQEEEQNRVLQEAVKYAFENCGADEGDPITETQRNLLVGLLLEKLEPWIINQLSGRNKLD